MKLTNKLIDTVKPSATLSITTRAKELVAQGVNVVSLGAGEPDFDTPDHIKDACIKALKAGRTKYAPTVGTPDLRKAIAAKLLRDNGLTYAVEQIIVSCGGKDALYNLFNCLLEPGDEVLIPSPYWVSYPEFVTLARGTSVFMPTTDETGFRITPAQLEKAITPRTRVLVLNTPSNPTGMGYDEAAQKELAVVLRTHPRVVVVSDEIYEHLTYGGFKHVSFAKLAPDLYERTFTVNAFSKTYSMTGWRLGYTACPNKEFASAMGRLQDHSTSGPVSFTQDGAVAALNASQDCVEMMRTAFEERAKYFVDALNRIPGVHCLFPQGAFYVFPNFAAWKIPSFELAKRLLDEAHVAAIPGGAFGADDHLRMSFATSMDNLKQAAGRIGDWAERNVNH